MDEQRKSAETRYREYLDIKRALDERQHEVADGIRRRLSIHDMADLIERKNRAWAECKNALERLRAAAAEFRAA